MLRLKFTKFAFHRGSAAGPAGGAYSAPHAPSCKGTPLKRTEKRRKGEEKVKESK